MSQLSDAPVSARIHGMPCSIETVLASLDDESRADLEAWFRGERPDLGSDDTMWARLQSLGCRVGRQTIGRHRRGECRCGA